MLIETPDVVTEFLRSRGLSPEPAYFRKTEFRLGWRLRLNDLDLVYRCEPDYLLICNLAVAEDGGDKANAVSTFIQLIHQIEGEITEVREVRGLMYASLDPEIDEMRIRLAEVLIAEGASWEPQGQEDWLVYPMQHEVVRVA